MAGMFDLQPSGNMVSDFLGKAAQSVYPDYTPASTTWSPTDLFPKGSALGTSYTPSMFGPSQDYSSVFNQAAKGYSGGPSISGVPGGGGSGSRSAARSTGPRLGSGGSYVMPGEPPPLDFYLGPAPTLQDLNLNYEEMGKRAMEANKPYAEQYRQFAPQTEAGARALSQAGSTYATGQLSRDMASQIGRGAAALGFSTGLGGRSGIGRNILARDLGLGSLQVQQQGADLLAKSSALAQQAMQAMNPISPNEVFSTAANQASINQQIANQNLMNAWQTQALPGQFDIRKGQYVGYQPGTYSTTKPLTPDLQASADLRNRAADLNSRSPGRFSVSGNKIFDSYSGRTI
jgi:hypothetical protein